VIGLGLGPDIKNESLSTPTPNLHLTEEWMLCPSLKKSLWFSHLQESFPHPLQSASHSLLMFVLASKVRRRNDAVLSVVLHVTARLLSAGLMTTLVNKRITHLHKTTEASRETDNNKPWQNTRKGGYNSTTCPIN